MKPTLDISSAVTLPAAIGVQEALIKKSPKKFYRPPYVGVRGWRFLQNDDLRTADREFEFGRMKTRIVCGEIESKVCVFWKRLKFQPPLQHLKVPTPF